MLHFRHCLVSITTIQYFPCELRFSISSHYWWEVVSLQEWFIQNRTMYKCVLQAVECICEYPTSVTKLVLILEKTWSENLNHIHSPKEVLKRLMLRWWIRKLEQNLKGAMHSKYKGHQTNIYDIWYIKYYSICEKIEMRIYPQKHFQLNCLPGGHINWNKGQIFVVLVCH